MQRLDETRPPLPGPILDSVLVALRNAVGAEHLVTDANDLAPHLSEERKLFIGHAPAMVKPKNTAEVAACVKICHKFKIPVVVQGGNTGLVGGGVPNGAIIISMDRLNHIDDVDRLNLSLTVEAGAILAHVQDAAQKARVYFPLSLGAEGSCQIGGNLATNAGGVHVLRYGNARDLVLGLEVVLPDGQIWNGLRALAKDNTGYDLKSLFLGAEGTLGIITRAVLRLYPAPKATSVALIGCEGFASALDIFQCVRDRAHDVLNACEVINHFAMTLAETHATDIKCPLKNQHHVYVLLEFSSTDSEHDINATMETALADAFDKNLIEDAVIAQSGPQADAIWAIREAIPEAQKREGGSIKHDISVPISKIPEFIDLATKQATAMIPGVRVCAFGHMGDGNIHFNLSQPVDADKQDFLGQWQTTNQAIHDVVMDLGGSFSAEHGVGVLKKGEMRRLKSPVELSLMQTLKTALDPHNIMNPGKLLPPPE